MLQNDLGFVYRDIDQDVENLENVIKELMLQHRDESVAAPFFYDWELDDLRDQLPSSWILEINEKLNVPNDKIRITVLNAYFDASRHFDDYLKEFEGANVKLIGEPIGCINLNGEDDEGIVVITNIDAPYDEENEASLLECFYANGESPYKIAITPGEKWDFEPQTFSCPGEYTDDDFKLDKSIFEKISAHIKNLMLC
jgi:hypothetical protein